MGGGEQLAKKVVKDLKATEFFESVRLGGQDSPHDLLVRASKEGRTRSSSFWCQPASELSPYATAMIQTMFLYFAIPVCVRIQGYSLAFVSRDGRAEVPFEFEYEELAVAGWLAPLLLPSRGWQLPTPAKEPRIALLRSQLAEVASRLFDIGPDR